MNLHVHDALSDDASTIAEFNSRMAVETKGRLLDPELIDAGRACTCIRITDAKGYSQPCIAM